MGQTRYEQVSAYLYSRIAAGDYPVGEKIPTENELASLLGVSRPTVRQALDGLARAGYLVRIKGKGTFVTQPKVMHESTTFLTGYREESRKNHRILRTRVLALETERASERVAQALALEPGERVTRLTRLRWLEDYHNGAPVVYTTVYVPYKLFPDMVQIDFTDTSFYSVLSARNLEVKHAVRNLEVALPERQVAAGLGISPFEPVIFIASQGWTAAMAAVDVGWAGSGAASLDVLLRQVLGLPCRVYGTLAGTATVYSASPDTAEGFFFSGQMDSYLFSQSKNRDLWKFHNLGEKHNLYMELLFTSPSPGLRGFALGEEGEVVFRYGREEKHADEIRRIQKGILDFVRDYMRCFPEFLEGETGWISGRDAYAPLLLFLRDRRIRRKFEASFCWDTDVNVE